MSVLLYRQWAAMGRGGSGAPRAEEKILQEGKILREGLSYGPVSAKRAALNEQPDDKAKVNEAISGSHYPRSTSFEERQNRAQPHLLAELPHRRSGGNPRQT
jgi:hypothetical protein